LIRRSYQFPSLEQGAQAHDQANVIIIGFSYL
jgi:hypothetical protein